MRAALLMIAAVTVAACQPIAAVRKPPPPKPEGPSIVVLVSKTGQPARDLMHVLGARCWLDGVVRGANMIVKPSGNLEIVGDTELLVAAEFVGNKGARSRWRLTGVSIGDPVKRARLVETLDKAVKTGDTFCPILRS